MSRIHLFGTDECKTEKRNRNIKIGYVGRIRRRLKDKKFIRISVWNTGMLNMFIPPF
jgi:hypothetical protein